MSRSRGRKANSLIRSALILRSVLRRETESHSVKSNDSSLSLGGERIILQANDEKHQYGIKLPPLSVLQCVAGFLRQASDFLTQYGVKMMTSVDGQSTLLIYK